MTTKTVGKRRLLKLADFLETLPRKRFDYDRWVDSRTWKGSPSLSGGMTACALGWATTIPSFRRAGLRLEATPTFEGSTNESAAAKFFGLNKWGADALFVPGSGEENATPKYVAKKIRKFVKGWE